MKQLTEAEFYAQYKPIPAADQSDLWRFEDIGREVPHTRIWSVADGDDGQAFAMSGCHVVNVFAHMVTEVPWTEDTEVLFDAVDPE